MNAQIIVMRIFYCLLIICWPIIGQVLSPLSVQRPNAPGQLPLSGSNNPLPAQVPVSDNIVSPLLFVSLF